MESTKRGKVVFVFHPLEVGILYDSPFNVRLLSFKHDNHGLIISASTEYNYLKVLLNQFSPSGRFWK